MSTIVALSTPPGRSAIAIIRLSGPDSLRIAGELTKETPLVLPPREATLKSIYDSATDDVLDRVLVTYMQAPNSFTGEDVVEISAHGSPVVVRRIIDLALASGARVADPGEFTLRGLANGKLDLSQAEAIRDLINAQTDAAARQAVRQLNGELAGKLLPIKQELIQVIIRLESALEFVEDDLPQLENAGLLTSLREICVDLEALASTFNAGHWLRDGISVTIAGEPNVGKSSLFNRLLKRERAIVTAVPGTTRDTISETINIGGVPVSLTDTAGLRGTPDEIEKLGIDRAQEAIADADLVLMVVDGSRAVTAKESKRFSELLSSRYLMVVNKSDLADFNLDNYSVAEDVQKIPVSALTGDGFDDLCTAITTLVGVDDSSDTSFVITDARHYDLLEKSRKQIKSAIPLLAGDASEELILVGLHNALRFLGAITGETTSEDILCEIFATFCIGK